MPRLPCRPCVLKNGAWGGYITLALLGCLLTLVGPGYASGMLALADLVSNAKRYDHQKVAVVGTTGKIHLGTNQKGQLGYTFLLKEGDKAVRIVAWGKPVVHQGERVMVEGIFRNTPGKLRFKEIKADHIRNLERLDPDLVG